MSNRELISTIRAIIKDVAHQTPWLVHSDQRITTRRRYKFSGVVVGPVKIKRIAERIAAQYPKLKFELGMSPQHEHYGTHHRGMTMHLLR